ncbi:hypothetical protein ACQYAD_12270 [Neobacillus sp. SM06]|uniref:hypothetical protein n=1 Tax=Neobacillus sp. SM06 TaxID=3422492 RepID=UPI003D275947
MIKSKKIIITAALVAGLGISAVFYASSTTKADQTASQNAFSNLVQEHQITKSKDKKPFVKINNKTYENTDFLAYKESKNVIQRNNSQPVLSDEEIKGEFIKESVLEQEADKQNFNVSSDEAKAFADKMKQAVAEAKDPQTQQFLKDYTSSLGITEDEYWSQYATPAYQKALKIGKLKQNFYMEEKAKNDSISDADLNKAWEQQQEKLVSEANVEILQ